MKQSTFNYIKDILREFNDLKKYIEKREEEIRYPYRTMDLNSDIKGNLTSNDSMINTMITMEEDRRLSLLKKNYIVIDDLLNKADDMTYKIINELYLKKFPRYTLTGLCENNIIKCSRNTASKKRTHFFEEVAKQLDLQI